MPSSGGRKPTSGLDGGRSGVGVDRQERDRREAGRVVECDVDVDVEGDAVVGHRDRSLVILGPGGDRQVRIAEADSGQLERAEIEARVELIGDRDFLRRCGRRGRVLEVDPVREERECRAGDKGRAVDGVTRWPDLGVGVLGVHGRGCGMVGVVSGDGRASALIRWHRRSLASPDCPECRPMPAVPRDSRPRRHRRRCRRCRRAAGRLLVAGSGEARVGTRVPGATGPAVWPPAVRDAVPPWRARPDPCAVLPVELLVPRWRRRLVAACELGAWCDGMRYKHVVGDESVEDLVRRRGLERGGEGRVFQAEEALERARVVSPSVRPVIAKPSCPLPKPTWLAAVRPK